MGTSHQTAADVRLIASDDSWIEGDAVRQLNTTAELPGIEYAVGFPDLHPGKAFPVGAAFVSRDCLYPLLAGNDIGCAMAFWRHRNSRRLSITKPRHGPRPSMKAAPNFPVCPR